MGGAQNPEWTRDELIVVLDLYFQLKKKDLSSDRQMIEEVSQVLNALSAYFPSNNSDSFRNYNGIKLRLGNYMFLDPDYIGKGMKNTGKHAKRVWDEFENREDDVHRLAQLIRNEAYSSPISSMTAEEDSDFFPEGTVAYKTHRRIERNKKVIKLKKKQALLNGSLSCEVCGFDFEKFYGSVGEGFIECHHTRPISEYRKEDATQLSDLVLVCSNCHRMLHIRRPWLILNQLSFLISYRKGD